MMALLLALTANLGVGSLVDSFRTAFLDWLECARAPICTCVHPQVDYRQLAKRGERENWLVDSHHRIGVTSRWQERPALLRGIDPRRPDSLALPLSRWLGDSPQAALRAGAKRRARCWSTNRCISSPAWTSGETIELRK